MAGLKTIVSKGNWRNYYGYGFETNPIEILKVRGCFYVAKLKEWWENLLLMPTGDALKEETFTLIEKSEDEGEL